MQTRETFFRQEKVRRCGSTYCRLKGVDFRRYDLQSGCKCTVRFIELEFDARSFGGKGAATPGNSLTE